MTCVVPVASGGSHWIRPFSGLRLIRENKLREYQRYYNERRAHTGRYGDTPIESRGDHVIALNNY